MRLIDACITQLKAQRPSRTCNESKEEEEEFRVRGLGFGVWGSGDLGVWGLGFVKHEIKCFYTLLRIENNMAPVTYIHFRALQDQDPNTQKAQKWGAWLGLGGEDLELDVWCLGRRGSIRYERTLLSVGVRVSGLLLLLLLYYSQA